MPAASDHGLPFVKLQGVGNDFVLLDCRERPDYDWPGLAEAMCARGLGIGSDGLLVVLASEVATARMRMFNPDGTEDMCGNGLRCVVRYLHDRDELPAQGASIEALSGVRDVRALTTEDGTVFSVDMGAPSLEPRSIPASVQGERALLMPIEAAGETVVVTLVSMGTPHAVIANHAPLPHARWLEVSAAIESHKLFPERITATWVDIVGRDQVRARFFERAVGPTLACGTGACAAAVACVLNGWTDRRVRVIMPGGAVEVEWEASGRVLMTGPAESVYTGWWPDKKTGRPSSYAR